MHLRGWLVSSLLLIARALFPRVAFPSKAPFKCANLGFPGKLSSLGHCSHPTVSWVRRKVSASLSAGRVFLLSLVLSVSLAARPVLASSGGRISGGSDRAQSQFVYPSTRERTTLSESHHRYHSRDTRSFTPRSPRRTVAIIEHSRGGSYDGVANLGEKQSYAFILALLAAAASRPMGQLLRKITKRSSFYKVQLAYYLNGNELQSAVNHIASTSASYAKGTTDLPNVVEDVCLLALRHKEALVGADIVHRRFRRGDDSFEGKANDLLQSTSMGERTKYDRETTSGGSSRSEIGLSVDATFKTYFVLTLLFACKGPLLKIQSPSSKTHSHGLPRSAPFLEKCRKRRGPQLCPVSEDRATNSGLKAVSLLARNTPLFSSQL